MFTSAQKYSQLKSVFQFLFPFIVVILCNQTYNQIRRFFPWLLKRDGVIDHCLMKKKNLIK